MFSGNCSSPNPTYAAVDMKSVGEHESNENGRYAHAVTRFEDSGQSGRETAIDRQEPINDGAGGRLSSTHPTVQHPGMQRHSETESSPSRPPDDNGYEVPLPASAGRNTISSNEVRLRHLLRVDI